MRYRLTIEREICSNIMVFPLNNEGLLDAFYCAAHWAKKDCSKITIDRTKTGEVIWEKEFLSREKELAPEVL